MDNIKAVWDFDCKIFAKYIWRHTHRYKSKEWYHRATNTDKSVRNTAVLKNEKKIKKLCALSRAKCRAQNF